MESKVLVEVERNNVVESQHRGWIAVCGTDGRLINGTHNDFPEFFIRSSLKPIQALPFLQSKAMEKFNFGLKELAAIVSSHSGEMVHIETVKHILDSIGLDESYLKCGTHIPYSSTVANNLLINKLEPTPIYCNCSGKHAGMLAVCLLNGWSLDDYVDYSHPLQKLIRNYLDQLLDIHAETLKWGIDGCGVPTYSLPLNKLALLYARLVNSELVPEMFREDFNLITKAFLAYPHIIAGPGRIDTIIMEAAPGKFISKIGGEAVLGFGMLSEKIGIAIKIEDGANRPILPILALCLKKLGLSVEEFPFIENLMVEPIYNNLQNRVGNIKPVFDFIV